MAKFAPADKRFTDYEEQTSDALEIPADLTPLTDEELAALSTEAVDAFGALYGDGKNLSADALTTLGALTEGIEALQAETARREAEYGDRGNAAAELAAKIGFSAQTADEDARDDSADDSDDSESEDDDSKDDADEDNESAAQTETLARKPIKVTLAGLRPRVPLKPEIKETGEKTPSIKDFAMAAPDVPNFSNGQAMDFVDMGKAVDSRLTTFSAEQYAMAQSRGQHIRQQFGVATIRKPFAEGLSITSDSVDHVNEVFAKATDQSRLPEGSLVASGGWCAPSEVLYDLFELESNDGLISLPEVHVARGGIKWTPGPTFQSIYSQVGFFYTEAQDQAGNYNGVGGGSKPCFNVPCPPFQEARLNLDGICITAGLLEQRGYPEMIARTIRGALVAHNHLMAGRKINALVNGSTAVNFPSPQAGAVAPLLAAIELQVENYKETHRMSRNTVLEAIFPFWVRGAIRADLSRRAVAGLDTLSVTDAMIDQWFKIRGIAPQFVYNFQDMGSVPASGETAYPSTVQFLLYAAGTWIVGSSDVITLDTVYDSTMLGVNNYTALFTEEGWLVAKKGHDSRIVTVPIEPTGATDLTGPSTSISPSGSYPHA